MKDRTIELKFRVRARWGVKWTSEILVVYRMIMGSCKGSSQVISGEDITRVPVFEKIIFNQRDLVAQDDGVQNLNR